MEKIGIICEYNPLHNGHIHHLKKIKELYPESIIILVMSGFFTQRGDISLLSKYNKTKLAIENGIDIVVELPTIFTLNSADIFADQAIKLLNYFNVDKIVFGSETNDLFLLKKLAIAQIDNKKFDDDIKKYMSRGLNYSSATNKALGIDLMSNDILGVAYIKSILKNKYKIEPITIERTSTYNNLIEDNNIISASNIRNRIKNGESIKKYIPNYNSNLLNSIDYEHYFKLLKYKIMTDNDLNIYLGVDEGLANKLKKEIIKCTSIDELLNRMKSRRYTVSRINRMLSCIFIGILKTDVLLQIKNPRILGFSKKGQCYLKGFSSNKELYMNLGRAFEIEKRISFLYFDLTHDKTSLYDVLNKPIIM